MAYKHCIIGGLILVVIGASCINENRPFNGTHFLRDNRSVELLDNYFGRLNNVV